MYSTFNMYMLILLIPFAVTATAASTVTDYYCGINPNHTLCIHQGISPRCGQGSYGGYLTEKEKQDIVNTHNLFRLRIANGEEYQGLPGPQPPASDMQLLVWDDELAYIAQMWADQCVFDHDLNRDTSRFNVGQNIFQSEGGVPWKEAIYSWYSEVEFFDKNLVDNFINDKVTDHYSQIVWGNTRYIGCGKRTYPQKRRLYKRDTLDQNKEIENLNPEGNDEENVRQPRKIYSGQYSNRVQQDYTYNNFQKENDYNWNNDGSYNKKQNYHNNIFGSQVKAYNNTLHEYLEKYKNSLQFKDDYKKLLNEYKKYIDQLEQFSSSSRDYDGKLVELYDLENKYQVYKNIHDRQLYYDKQLKTMQANKKKLNPVISVYYGFTTPYPITPGIEHEYYVCNYGPAGNIPGARMYTKGDNKCGSLCQDPLTRHYYPPLEKQNDPILSGLYSKRRK